jgi:cortactin
LIIIHRFVCFFVDGKKGFGGEHGVDERAKDKSAVGFDYKATVEKHSSQTGLKKKICIKTTNDRCILDSSKGFGGKFGTDENAQDKSAVGFSYKETVPKHSSQTGSKKDLYKRGNDGFIFRFFERFWWKVWDG